MGGGEHEEQSHAHIYVYEDICGNTLTKSNIDLREVM